MRLVDRRIDQRDANRVAAPRSSEGSTSSLASQYSSTAGGAGRRRVVLERVEIIGLDLVSSDSPASSLTTAPTARPSGIRQSRSDEPVNVNGVASTSVRRCRPRICATAAGVRAGAVETRSLVAAKARLPRRRRKHVGGSAEAGGFGAWRSFRAQLRRCRRGRRGSCSRGQGRSHRPPSRRWPFDVHIRRRSLHDHLRLWRLGFRPTVARGRMKLLASALRRAGARKRHELRCRSPARTCAERPGQSPLRRASRRPPRRR